MPSRDSGGPGNRHDSARAEESARWWKEGVLYQIYPRSFADSDGDGVGDLRGIIGRLDYLEWLGVDGLWLNPITPSPNDDWGYDVSDYKSVHPELGTLEDIDELIADAGRRGIRIILDFVPNHTSSEHEWFKDARSARDARCRDFYVWANAKEDGSPPNNWLSTFGGSAWELDDRTGEFYLHNFLPTQPDLNWWNEDVRAAMDDILRFWFDRGVAGFRIDVAHAVVKDKELRDNLPATDEDHPLVRRHGQRHTYSMDQPEVHDVIRRWRGLADSYDPPRILTGETFLLDLARMAAYYGTGDELHLAFNFPFVFSRLNPQTLADVVDLTQSLLPDLAWPVWTGSNHDVLRFPTRWCEGDDRRIRVALMMLLTLRGTPFLYYGDEIGMMNTELAPGDVKDPVGKRHWSEDVGRDPCRTPMHWRNEDDAGFTDPGVEPWLPFGDTSRNVADQRRRADSILNFTRDLIAVRKGSADLKAGRYERMKSPEGTWVYRRGAGTVVALNFSSKSRVFPHGEGRMLLGTSHVREGERVINAIELSPWEGVITAPSVR